MRRILLVAGLIVGFASDADSHSWYSATCCSGKDCAPIHFSKVKVSPGSYTVTLFPGDHPMVDKPMQFQFPTTDDRVKPAQDMQYHICISKYTKRLLCFYKPDAGV